jgi:hypothetical protein
VPHFREIVVADFEFAAPPGERPKPLCLVARELFSGRRFRVWCDEFETCPPYATGPDVLFVAYYASAELGSYRVLDWPMPERILDLFTEFRDRTNGIPTVGGAGLLGAMSYFGLDGVGATTKKELQEAIGTDKWRGGIRRGGPGAIAAGHAAQNRYTARLVAAHSRRRHQSPSWYRLKLISSNKAFPFTPHHGRPQNYITSEGPRFLTET